LKDTLLCADRSKRDKTIAGIKDALDLLKADKSFLNKSKRNNHSLLLKDDRGRKDNTPRLGSK